MSELDVGKFAELARIKLKEEEKERFKKDFGTILAHVEELQSLGTKDIPPVTGGTDLKNVFREDAPEDTRGEGGEEAFPEAERGYLKVPKIFE